MTRLGYAIRAYKAVIEVVELKKGNAGKKWVRRKKSSSMTSEKPNVIKTSLALRSTEEILDANIF